MVVHDIGPDLAEPALLIVDDVQFIVEEFLILLDLVGIPAVGASSLATAMAQLRQHPAIRVVIADVRLPREDGFDLELQVRADPALADRGIEFIFMSGQVDLTGQQLARTVLPKPLDMGKLVPRVKAMLAAPRLG